VRARPDRNPLVVEEFPQRLRGISIFTVDQGVGPLDNRHAAASQLSVAGTVTRIGAARDESLLAP
jgi:hypothetical protein